MNWLIPISGILIGWITNIIAVEMLFNPRKPIMLFGVKMPFTPGLIPQNRKKMLDAASKRVSSVVIDTLSDSGATDSYKMFSKLVDGHWLTQLFVSESAKKKIYKGITTNVIKTKEFNEMLNKLIRKQLNTYSVSELEETVKKLSNESLKGIKVLGAIIGGLVGLVTMIIGGI